MIYNANNRQLIVNRAAFNILKVLISLAISIRLSLLPHDIFKDRVNYLRSIVESKDIFFDMFTSNTLVLFNEPLFKALNYTLSFFIQPDLILSLYVFVNCFTVIFFILFNRASFFYSLLGLLLLLVVPYFYGATMGAIRQGLGFNILLIGLMRRDSLTSNRFILYLFLASLFHIIFFVFITLVLSYKFIIKIFKNDKYVLPIIFMIILMIGIAWRLATPYLSGSQSYEGFETTTSGFSFIGWFIIFIFFICNYIFLNKKKIAINKSTFILTFIMYLSFIVFYWLAPGPYRIIYSCTPLLVYSLMSHVNKYSVLCYCMLLLYGVLLSYAGAGNGSMNIKFSDFTIMVLTGA